MANLCRRGHLKKSSKHAVCMKCYAMDREKHLEKAREYLRDQAAKRMAEIAQRSTMAKAIAENEEAADGSQQTGEG